MRINEKAVTATIKRHLNDGLDATVERLHFDDHEVCAMFAKYLDPEEAAVITGAMAVGIDLGLQLAESLRPKEPRDNGAHDAFLSSLPEAYSNAGFSDYVD